MAHKELVVAWLNDAHAMELGIAQVLERHAEEAKDHPRCKPRCSDIWSRPVATRTWSKGAWSEWAERLRESSRGWPR